MKLKFVILNTTFIYYDVQKSANLKHKSETSDPQTFCN